MAHIGNKSFFILDADFSPGFNPGASGGIALVAGTLIFYFWDTGTTWNRIDMGALTNGDGSFYPIARGDSIEDVAPTAGEIPSPVNSDSASVYLTNGKHEFWTYNGTWTKAYVLQADEVSNLSNGTVDATSYTINNSNGSGVTLAIATGGLAGLMSAADKNKLNFLTLTQAVDLDAVESDVEDLTTLTGVASNAEDLGTFTGITIPDSSTIKAALQAIETAHDALQVQADYTTNRATSEAQVSSTVNVILSGEQTIDGVLTSGSRVLLVGQTDPSENGVYVSNAGAWSRATDLNTAAAFTVGRLIVVREGTDRADTLWANQATVATLEVSSIDIDCMKTCISGTQDNEFEIINDGGGIRIERQTLTAYATHALADAAVSVGDAYILTAANQEGIVSDGVSGPVFRRT